MNPPESSGSSIALGGEPVKVTYKDKSTGLVHVRELEIDPGLIKFVTLLLNEKLLVEFICDKPDGWASTLKPASVLDIVEKAKELNFSLARRYMELRAETMERLEPFGLTKAPTRSTASVPEPG
jgi:hypothetical protein